MEFSLWGRLSVAAGLGVLISGAAHAQTGMMSAAWAKSACDAWNAEPALTDKLVESGWMKNNANRGFKVIQVYRSDCKDSPRVELRIAEQGGKARCTYGGKVETAKLDLAVDYVMHAKTTRWQEMGRGEYGPMRAMMFGRLQFDGPTFEAMGNMGPFESFLLLVGKVPGDVAGCPAK
jgi:putative sterol carrier protein